MLKGFFNVPVAKNEKVRDYAPGTAEAESLLATYKRKNSETIDVPMYIGSEEIRTNDKRNMTSPHDHQHVLGTFSYGDKSHVEKAIECALGAKEAWVNLPWEHRASIFLRAAELVSGKYRNEINAATMLAQSKNAYQAEIDAACEYADFLRFNVQYMTEIYKEQPQSSDGIWNRLEYRPLEGFVFAITPFNFTAIAGNLCAAPAMMGNVIVWKPADTQVYSAEIIMKIFKEAGVPDGVINMITVDGPDAGDVIFNHADFAGLHFTGSTKVFKHLWKTIGMNIDKYKTYPRIVGETGGKDFIFAHHTSDALEVATGISRGAFEFQGQKCSAASRAYIPSNIWPAVEAKVKADIESFKIGSPEDFSNFVNAVISKVSFDKCAEYIEYAKKADDAEIIAGGTYDDSKGYFVSPTVIKTSNPKFKSMCEEIFGPIITIYVYEAGTEQEVYKLIDETSEYALTGAIFGRDRYALAEATDALKNAAGNFYINDKPTGAVVGQQPFGGARGSGTNDKAGAAVNLLRWSSMRMIKETFNTPTDYKYPFLG